MLSTKPGSACAAGRRVPATSITCTPFRLRSTATPRRNFAVHPRASDRPHVVAHYRFNSRADSDYWRANAAQQNLPDSLKSLMTCWFTGGDLVEEIARQDIAKYYAPLSWHCLMAGYGAFPEDAKMRAH